jgi:hypothetical protein
MTTHSGTDRGGSCGCRSTPSSGAAVDRPFSRRMTTLPALVLLTLALVSGSACSSSEPVGTQVGFRVRADDAQSLNSSEGWAGEYNENVTVQVDRPFRIRFELEAAAAASGARRFALQYRRNGEAWTEVVAEDFPKPSEASPRVSIVSSDAYAHGAATVDLLPGSRALFRPGSGVSLASHSTAWSGGTGHGEWEWPLVIRRFADGAFTNEDGDLFEFRMVDADGRAVASSLNPVVTVAVPPGHLGGTFVETPGRIGPWDASNGDLYFIMEPAETDNRMMIVKSADRGASWHEVDGAHRPAQSDLEGVASALHGSTIYVLHQRTRQTWLHSFRTSDHPTHPDSWELRDELVARHTAPLTQASSIAVRSDGSIVAVYAGTSKIHLRIRSSQGVWGPARTVDTDAPEDLSGPRLVLGADDVVHLAYAGSDGTAWYRRIEKDGTMTRRAQISTGLDGSASGRGSILPLVFLPATNTVAIIYRLSSGYLWERRIVAHAPPSAPVQVSDRPVVQNAVDSQQAGADAIADGDDVHVLFIERGSGSIYYTRRDVEGGWLPSIRQVDGIRGSWVRGALLSRGTGPRAYGYVYDAGSSGGGGMNRFSQVLLEARG